MQKRAVSAQQFRKLDLPFFQQRESLARAGTALEVFSKLSGDTAEALATRLGLI